MEPISSLLTVWHMGPLHAYERWLTVILAFGPFVLLALVFVIRRRMDDAEDEADGEGRGQSETPAEHQSEDQTETQSGGPGDPAATRTSDEERPEDASGRVSSVRQPGESDAVLDLERRAE